jgi:opacity protein-like surface antigen
MKRTVLMVMMVLVLAVAPVCAATTGFYTGFQIGPSFSNTQGTDVNGVRTPNFKFNPGLAFGGQFGYDFAYLPNAPKFAKYFGVALDYMHLGLPTTSGLSGGNQNTFGFLGIVKYPFFANKTYPAGRVAPYLAAGPGIVWTNLAGVNSTNVAVIVEPGVRMMVSPRISVDGAYRFQYCKPSLSNGNDKVTTNNNNNLLLARVNFHF